MALTRLDSLGGILRTVTTMIQSRGSRELQSAGLGVGFQKGSLRPCFPGPIVLALFHKTVQGCRPRLLFAVR
jgi:hypothetical protein